MAGKIPTREVDHKQAALYWKKSQEFYDSMTDNYAGDRWNAAALSAIHCAISSADAILVAEAGLRSSSQKHSDLTVLLQQKVMFKGTDDAAGHLRKILNQKNLVEYESRLFTRKEADEIVKHAERFFEWVKTKIVQKI